MFLVCFGFPEAPNSILHFQTCATSCAEIDFTFQTCTTSCDEIENRKIQPARRKDLKDEVPGQLGRMRARWKALDDLESMCWFVVLETVVLCRQIICR